MHTTLSSCKYSNSMEEAGRSKISKLSIKQEYAKTSDYDSCSKNICDIVYSVSIGDNRVIESIYTASDATTSPWITKVLTSTPRPVIAGLCTYRLKPNYKLKREELPISLVSLCVGSYCLLLPLDDERQRCRSGYHRRGTLPRSILAFLMSGKVKILGLGIEKIEESLEREWGVKLTGGIELATVVERCGKEGLEDMASRLLDGLRVPRREGRKGFGWYGEEELMHASVDAYLTYQIGAKLFSIL